MPIRRYDHKIPGHTLSNLHLAVESVSAPIAQALEFNDSVNTVILFYILQEQRSVNKKAWNL